MENLRQPETESLLGTSLNDSIASIIRKRAGAARKDILSFELRHKAAELLERYKIEERFPLDDPFGDIDQRFGALASEQYELQMAAKGLRIEASEISTALHDLFRELKGHEVVAESLDAKSKPIRLVKEAAGFDAAFGKTLSRVEGRLHQICPEDGIALLKPKDLGLRGRKMLYIVELVEPRRLTYGAVIKEIN
jgi:hypothetical protein